MKLVRLRDASRPRITLTLEGQAIEAQQGDTLLTALLAAGAGHLRESEFGDGPRAGFCLMGACQDCWVVVEGMGRVRACATLAAQGMEVRRG
ncbi:2Fe-2S iron-sulfur cluster-binding protein [Neoroseomonas oryzicola]|uniref:(2Fe-2S)-binding protein n=1 Tax=Neoroseomonas oryzicola TaxID=535904 RepID=A0A9X9WBK8_9PROT|nr:(2Fe-2S)-binding protein [Neoroseomonas oryzicola]NKE18974.1 (2Fe-2S)-binding protein [Neoroseomonas oryzicola]